MPGPALSMQHDLTQILLTLTLWGGYNYHHHLTGKKTGTWKGEGTCSRSHLQNWGSQTPRQAGCLTHLRYAASHGPAPSPGPPVGYLPLLLPPEHVGLLDSQRGGPFPSLQAHSLWCPFRCTSVSLLAHRTSCSVPEHLSICLAFFAKLLQKVFILLVSL